MTLQQLRDLVAVITHGGYRAAARAQGRSQAGLTKSVAKLEREHGVMLFDRGGQGASLNSDGEQFVRYAQAILLEADRAEEWLKAPHRRRAASVSLGVSIEPSLRLVPSVLEDYRRVLPDVTVRMTHGVSSELIAGVRENRLELAVSRLPADLHAVDLKIDVLYESEPVVAARKGHPLARATSLAELCGCDWVVVGDPSQPGANDASIRELFDNHSLGRPRIAAVTDSLFGAIATLIESECLARLPRTALDHPLVAGQLVALQLREAPGQYPVALLRKASRPLTREAQTLAAMLTSYARISRGLSAPSGYQRSPPRR
ncbi:MULTISPECIES: LysR substrate-binding domain-containing protein [unclassified Variovorax]|uniref:LysR family transcriptional regulator n=1 Tax=unclassified Variovorax TaxID=663243 RepID=UPI00076BF18C|nr:MULTISPECIES: LysR substrate-binding domain-containing protein [unclassified Variovorax]KWT70650.1 LysR-family transcriptional regulator [Variovorax sp. WDL1]PNG47134.1 HTH-type transcriptional regulator TsaR [Variovorax sp. B2]PNG48215.1 HTH-type transcriptional regulator TsaR [Variovorax sp. B4]VTV15002.1 Galactose-binding protein regulator [Variovorax sp. WDL1]